MVDPPKQPNILERLAAFAIQRARWAALILSVGCMLAAVALLLSLLGASRATDGNASSASALAAAAAVLFAAWQFGQQDAARRSKFALDMAMEGVRRAYAIVDVPGRATRIQWVNAGRVMARAMQTAKNVGEPDHRDAWDQFREEWRIKFYHFLTKSPEYYLGLDEPADFDPNRMAYLDDRLIDLLRKTKIKSRFAMTHRTGTGTSTTMLSMDSVRPIYDFAQYDRTWLDPLDGVDEFSSSDERSMMNRDMKGLSLAVYAQNKWTVVGSQVIERKKYDEGNWTPDEDDDEE